MELGQGRSRGIVVKKKIKSSRIQKNLALRRKTQEKKKPERIRDIPQFILESGKEHFERLKNFLLPALGRGWYHPRAWCFS